MRITTADPSAARTVAGRPWRRHRGGPVDELTRRGLMAGSVGTVAAWGLTGCGSSGSSANRAEGSTRRVKHKYGSTEVPERVARVVTLGYIDQEPVLALGVRPVGVVDFFGERPYGDWPWERPLWRGAEPQIVGNRDEYEFEKIVALKPDLIIGLYSGMTRQNYETLSKIAPTVAQPKGYADFSAPWTVMTETVGRCLGKQDAARKLIRGVRSQFAAAREKHPEWSGRTVAVAEPFKAGEWAVFGAGDPKVQFFTELGFRVAPAVRKLEPGGDVANISTERLDLLDVDRLVLLIDKGDQTESEVRADQLFANLDVAADRTLFLPFGTPPPVGAALSFNSVLSIPYGIERVVSALSG